MKWKLMASVLLLLGCVVVATAGPAWVEGGDGDDDAGSLPGNAQITIGGLVMLTISGRLEGAAAANGVADFEDMYLIQIDDPDTFSATTAFFPGYTEFDSRLFLFEGNGNLLASGIGKLGNEDTGGPPPLLMRLGEGGPVGACCFPDGYCMTSTEDGCVSEGGVYQGDETDCKSAECQEWYGACCTGDGCYDDYYTYCTQYGGIFLGDGTSCETDDCPNEEGSTMGGGATDGSGAMVTQPGLYYLAITVTPRSPTSPGGEIFNFVFPNEVSGPDGPGGGQPISTWSEPPPIAPPANLVGAPGNYTILLGGVGFSQADCQWDLNGDGYVTLHDVFELINAWGPCPAEPEPCPADFNGDGMVDWGDLSELLGNLGPCPVDSNCPPDFNGDGFVDKADLAELLDNFGNCPDGGEECPWDLNGNGHVCIGDMLILLFNWGACP